MRQEVFKIVMTMDFNNINTQLVMQCAPLISGLKVSNMLTIQNKNIIELNKMLKHTELSLYPLLIKEDKSIFLLYHSQNLEKYLLSKNVINLLRQLGYHEFNMKKLLSSFRERYSLYMLCKEKFPHEMGLFLGYPIEDVKGFILSCGKDSLYTGYWKVYENMEKKIRQFQEFDLAKEELIHLVTSGKSMDEIIELYSDKKMCQRAI